MPPRRQRRGIHTKTWWQAKTGWTDDGYGDRLLALHDRLEAKWPEWLSAASLRPTWNVGSLKEWLQPFVLTINDANWCAPGRNLEERVDEQLRHYIGWALDFRMRPENQDTIAAIAERHQERHEQQTLFTQQRHCSRRGRGPARHQYPDYYRSLHPITMVREHRCCC